MRDNPGNPNQEKVGPPQGGRESTDEKRTAKGLGLIRAPPLGVFNGFLRCKNIKIKRREGVKVKEPM